MLLALPPELLLQPRRICDSRAVCVCRGAVCCVPGLAQSWQLFLRYFAWHDKKGTRHDAARGQKVQCPARKKQVERADEEVIFLRLTMRWARESLSGPCWADFYAKVGKDSRRGRRKCTVVIKCIKNQAREGRRNLARLSKTICERNPTNERPRECSKEGN